MESTSEGDPVTVHGESCKHTVKILNMYLQKCIETFLRIRRNSYQTPQELLS